MCDRKIYTTKQFFFSRDMCESEASSCVPEDSETNPKME